MEIIGFIVALGVGLILGMYIASQISESIDRRTSFKQFLKDMEEFDKRK